MEPKRKFCFQGDDGCTYLLDIVSMGETADGVTLGIIDTLAEAHGAKRLFLQHAERFVKEAMKSRDANYAPIARIYYVNIEGPFMVIENILKLNTEKPERIKGL